VAENPPTGRSAWDRRPGPPAVREPDPRPRFEIAMRGYDRGAVDAFLEAGASERLEMRKRLEASERERQQAEQHAAATERENRTLREGYRTSSASPADERFGFRVQKLMRLAEQEAADVRVSAAREASALLEQARAQGERHRHEVEQNLIARSAALDEQASVRIAELQERERQVAEQLASAQAAADALRDAANRAVEQQLAQAEAEVESVRARAEHEAHRFLEQARAEGDRLTALTGGARAELTRLVELIDVELGRDTDPPPSGRSSEAVVEPREPVGPASATGDRPPVAAATGR